MQSASPGKPKGQEITRESVKTLAIAVGVRESARQLGIPEATVQAWSAREGWFKRPEMPASVLGKQGATIATKTTSQALSNVLSTRKEKSRLNLSQYVLNGSKVAARSRSPLADAGKVKDLATVMEKVWPEEKVKNDNGLVAIQLIHMELPKEEKRVSDYPESQAALPAQ